MEYRADKKQLLNKYFGYDEFREGQELLIDSILSGKDTFGIMPTGAGKSLCFQIPALIFDGITLVVSPLISLMKDQVGALNQAGIHAAYLNSSLSSDQYFKALEYAKAGRYPIIYVAPERLLTDSFLNFAKQAEIAMVAVDEAHCVSQWGQDFRPGYLKITEFIEQLPCRPVVSAFTASATREVKEDIAGILRLREPTVLSTGFDRPNLYFEVQAPGNKYRALCEYLKKHKGESGIIYCLTRKQVETVCGNLIRDGVLATRYHAGLSDEERKKNQEDFIYDRVQVMVATNAFGMGIDKSNVRYVVHYNMPKNMESYYQEAGRAGRDGEPAECILYYSGQDVRTNRFFIENNQDNEALDEITRRLVRERDHERLRRMTYYCFTNECLRDYMLRYFGEYRGNYCGNCGNCMTRFEEIDMRETAGIILRCIRESGQRYGIQVLTDTLRGADTAKIRQYGMDKNSLYGSLSEMPAYKLRQVVNELLVREYAALSNDGYMVVHLTDKAEDILEGNAAFTMKMAKEREKGEKKRAGGSRKGAVSSHLKGKEQTLFEHLRNLRMEIARREKVPPYIVFSDKSLIHMCIMKPRSKEEMLKISGVGEYKYEKYGERFLNEIIMKS